MPSSDTSYDSDFDDTPPASPRLKRPKIPPYRRIYRQIRAYRGLIVFIVVCYLIVRWWSGRRKPFFTPKHEPSLYYKNIDWRLYAYSQYATDAHYLCNAVMVFDQLDILGSKADRVLLYPEHFDTNVDSSQDRSSQLLVKAEREYGAKLVPVPIEGMRTDKGVDPNASEAERMSADETWDTSITKFLAFNLTQYYRILHLDNDVTVLKNMDDIFLAPEARIGMTRAYWRLPSENVLTSLLMLIFPSVIETERLMTAAEKETRQNRTYDMEILNDMYGQSALVLPHRKYGLLTGEFRSKNHTNYHGNDYEKWDPNRALAEASLVHFSDHPLPKPWIMWPQQLLKEMMPKCDYMPGTPEESGCNDRDVWIDLYHDFRRRRKEVCGLLSVPAPDWPPVERESSGRRVD